MDGAIDTPEKMDRRRRQFAREEHQRLMDLYYKRKKEGMVSKAASIGSIINMKFGEGDNFANELLNNQF